MPPRLIALAAAGAVAVAVAVAVATPALAGSAPTKRVTVGDDYFAPKRVTVHRGTQLVFRWPAANNDRHDVKLTSAPHGVAKWHSPVRGGGYTYRRTLRAAGTYKIICTLHPTLMRLTVRVTSSG